MRNISAAFRTTIEAVRPTDAIVVLAAIYHSSLAVPICVNSDVVDYALDGETFVGCAFGLSFLTDDEQPPKASIAVPNVDRRIGAAALAMRESPRIKIRLFAKSNFNDENPRRVVGVAVAEYTAPLLFLRNVSGSALQVTADIFSYDLATEPWPLIRSTPDYLPAVYR